MKKPEEIASMPFKTDEDFRRKAGVLRRLVSGIRAEACEPIGLNLKEQALIHDAALLMDKIASAYKRAEQVSKKQREDMRMLEVVAQGCMAETFAALTDPLDQLALIASVRPWELGLRPVLRAELDRLFQQALDAIARQAARRSEGTVPENVDFYWREFQGCRAELREKFGKHVKG